MRGFDQATFALGAGKRAWRRGNEGCRGACLDGVNVAPLVMMTAVTIRLGHPVLVDPPTAVQAVVAAAP